MGLDEEVLIREGTLQSVYPQIVISGSRTPRAHVEHDRGEPGTTRVRPPVVGRAGGPENSLGRAKFSS
jgi:hypothetical protein